MSPAIMNKTGLAALLLASIACPVTHADTLVLRNATVHTGTVHGKIDNASIVLTDGRVTAVGEDGAVLPAPRSSI
jgi:imidazolonepropionase-like amidohydrolase